MEENTNMYTKEQCDLLREKYGQLSLKDTENIIRAKTDSEFREALIVLNEKIVWHSIHKYVGNTKSLFSKFNIPKEDLYQAAIIGFIKSIENFNPSYNFKFTSFVIPAIYREVRNYLRNNSSLIKPTRSGYELIQTVRRITANSNEYLDTETIADITETSEDNVIKALQMSNGVKYIDEMNQNADVDNYFEVESDDMSILDQVVENINGDYMLTVLQETLSDKEFDVICMKLDGLNTADISSQLFISRKSVNSIYKKAAAILNQNKIAKSPYKDIIKEVAAYINTHEATTKELQGIIRARYPQVCREVEEFIIAESIDYLEHQGKKIHLHELSSFVASQVQKYPALTYKEIENRVRLKFQVEIIPRDKLNKAIKSAYTFLDEYAVAA